MAHNRLALYIYIGYIYGLFGFFLLGGGGDASPPNSVTSPQKKFTVI